MRDNRSLGGGRWGCGGRIPLRVQLRRETDFWIVPPRGRWLSDIFSSKKRKKKECGEGWKRSRRRLSPRPPSQRAGETLSSRPTGDSFAWAQVSTGEEGNQTEWKKSRQEETSLGRTSTVGASRRYFSSSSSLISCQLFKNIKKGLHLKSPDSGCFISERYLIPGRMYRFIRPRRRNGVCVCVLRRLHPAVGPDFQPPPLALDKCARAISSHVEEAGGRKRAKSFSSWWKREAGLLLLLLLSARKGAECFQINKRPCCATFEPALGVI